MGVFSNKHLSRLLNGRSSSDSPPRSVDFAGDAAPPFAELASEFGRLPTPEELERIQYYNSKMAVKDTEFVVRIHSAY